MWITDNFAEIGWLELWSKYLFHMGWFSEDYRFNGIRSGFGQGI